MPAIEFNEDTTNLTSIEKERNIYQNILRVQNLI